MAEIYRLEGIKVDVDQITFDSDERLDVALNVIGDMNLPELDDVIDAVFENGSVFDSALRCASHIRGALDSDEEKQLLEELDFETPEPEPQTTEELISALTITATNGEGYSQAELRVIRKWVETAVRRTVGDFKSLRSLYRKAGE